MPNFYRPGQSAPAKPAPAATAQLSPLRAAGLRAGGVRGAEYGVLASDRVNYPPPRKPAVPPQQNPIYQAAYRSGLARSLQQNGATALRKRLSRLPQYGAKPAPRPGVRPAPQMPGLR